MFYCPKSLPYHNVLLPSFSTTHNVLLSKISAVSQCALILYQITMCLLSSFSTKSQCVIDLFLYQITMCYCPLSLPNHNVLLPSFSTKSQCVISLFLYQITMFYFPHSLPSLMCDFPHSLPSHNVIFLQTECQSISSLFT